MVESVADTRSRLLETAGEVFAQTGFREATVRDICRRAGANIAAVNYHFGGKEQLYRSVLEYSFAYAQERYPLALDPEATPESQLLTFVDTSLKRMMDQGKPAWHGQLIMREFSDPTGELDAIAERYMKPHFVMLTGILQELLGPAVPEERLRLMALSVLGQTVFYKNCKEAICRICPAVVVDESQRQAICNHIVGVSLSAVRDIREEYERGEKGRHQ